MQHLICSVGTARWHSGVTEGAAYQLAAFEVTLGSSGPEQRLGVGATHPHPSLSSWPKVALNPAAVKDVVESVVLVILALRLKLPLRISMPGLGVLGTFGCHSFG